MSRDDPRDDLACGTLRHERNDRHLTAVGPHYLGLGEDLAHRARRGGVITALDVNRRRQKRDGDRSNGEPDPSAQRHRMRG